MSLRMNCSLLCIGSLNKIDQGIRMELCRKAGDDRNRHPQDKKSFVRTLFINEVGRRMALIEPVEGQILQLPVGENGEQSGELKTAESPKAQKGQGVAAAWAFDANGFRWDRRPVQLSPHWIKVQNRKHPAMSRAMEALS